MTIQMDLKNGTFRLPDIAQICLAVITATVLIVTMQNGLSSLRDDVAEIRATQMENSKKQDLRWQIIETKQQQLELSQRLLEQRMDVMEKK